MITAIEGLPGTDGYRPPEYGDRKFSILSDVYSYGVVSFVHDTYIPVTEDTTQYIGWIRVLHWSFGILRRTRC